jgi:hypothetical protein
MRPKTKNDADKNDRMSLLSKCEVFQAGYCSAATASWLPGQSERVVLVGLTPSQL